MENIEPSKEAKTKIKGKYNKKNKILNDENIPEQTIKKKSNKKKIRKSTTNDGENNLSNMSIDSFHSAAGSPIKDCNEHIANNIEALDVPSKSTRSHDKVLESADTDNQLEDMQPRAPRSKIHSVKNLSLKDDEIKTKKNKDTKRKRKLKNESTNDEDVSNSSKVTVIEAIFPTTDSNETQHKHTDSFNNSAGFHNCLKNYDKKRRSKIQSTNDNLLTFEIENVDNVKTPNKLISTKESSTNKNSTYDEINVSETDFNATFDKESSYNSINQNDQPQGVLTKITKNSLKQKKTYDKTNVSCTNNLNSTFHKEISYECVTQFDHPENDFNNVNGTSEQTDINRNKKKIDSACDKTNCDTMTNLYETEITNVSNNHSKLTLENSTNINNSQNSNRKKIKSSYFKINFSETSLNVTIDEEMPENPINKSKESQNVITNDIKNSDKKKIKSSIRKSISNMFDASIINLDGTYEKDDSNLTQQKALRKSIRLSKYSLDQDVSSNMNATYDKSTITDSQPNSRRNSTFDITDKINTTFEMVKSTKLDATFDKSKKYDVTRRGSSLISSDNTNNTSSETSRDISRISITSDESMADNIVNVTPVLIESSIDASQTNISSFEYNKSIKENAETKNATNVTEIKTSRTPLKREGTYTEIQYATPPKHEGMFTEYKSTTTPKGKETFTVTKSPNTPIREGTYTELKSAITPLKREGTYTDLNPITTPSKKNEINIEINPKTPLKLNGVIESKNATPPLKIEGTFTKDSDVSESPKLQPDVNKTPTRRKSTELKSAITLLKREGTYTDINPITTPSKKNEINIEINPKTPLKLNGVIESKNATPPLKREGSFTKDSDVSQSPKLQPDVNKTPTRRKSTELKSAITPLKREKTYTDLNPITTPSKKNEINIEINPKTPLKLNGVIESKNATPPLKIEGTFTKDSDVSESPKLQPDVNKTPTRRKSTELKSAITLLKREGTYTDINPITTPSKKNEINIEINPKTPLKLNGVIESKNATPPLKREGSFTKDSDVSQSPKLQPDVNKTPTRRKSTELKSAITPLKRERTYTDLNPITTPSKKNEINIEINPKTPLKLNGVIESKNATPPLKIEGTFTKDSDVSESPKLQTDVNKTPTGRKSTELKSAITPLKRERSYTDLNPITTPSKKNEINIEINPKTPLKLNGVIESKNATPPLKREGSFTKDSDVSQSPKLQPDVNKTPTRRKSTGLKSAITPLKRERTYTDLNPITTPSKKNEINIEINPKTPLKLNAVIESKNATPPLKREGTFTKDSDVSESPKLQPDVNKTPTRRKSIEKSRRRSSVADLLPRATKVMFCNPVVTPVVVRQMKGKLIKSNLKGSDKSFVFDECVSDAIRPPRKRSYTQSEAEAISSKRKRLTPGQQQSVEHLSRRRTTSASGKLQDPGTSSIRVSTANKSKTEVTPSKSKPEGRVLRRKLPNFAALHQKQFAKMESLAECQERKAKRARQLLTPTGSVNMLERISPKETPLSPTTTELQPQAKIDTPNTSIIPPEYQGSTRFGFKLNTSVNPFSFPSKTETKPKINRESRIKPLKRQAMLPSLAGATNLRKEVAKQTVLREKSFIEKRDMKRVENRTIIKGVRTNRRFELQMKMRNVK